MIIDDYQMWMISDLANPDTAPRRELALKSWHSQGLYPQPVQATTPNTIDQCNFKIAFDKKRRLYTTDVIDFTETEKAIYYSHTSLLIQCSQSQTPFVVIEDDVELKRFFPDEWILNQAKAFVVCSKVMKRHPLRYTITPAAGYIITPQAAGKIVNYILSKPMHMNIDGVFFKVLDQEKYDVGGKNVTWSTLMEYNPIAQQLVSKSTIEHDIK